MVLAVVVVSGEFWRCLDESLPGLTRVRGSIKAEGMRMAHRPSKRSESLPTTLPANGQHSHEENPNYMVYKKVGGQELECIVDVAVICITALPGWSYLSSKSRPIHVPHPHSFRSQTVDMLNTGT